MSNIHANRCFTRQAVNFGRLGRIAFGALMLPLLLASQHPAFAQAAPPALKPFAWAPPGSGTSSNVGFASLIIVTPTSAPSSVATQLNLRPAGSRGLLMVGFADDITKRDTLKKKVGKKMYTIPSPWIPVGTAGVRTRVSAWISKLSVAHGNLDFALVRSPTVIQAASLNAYGAAGWKIIEADSRFGPVKAALSSQNLAVEMVPGSPKRILWDAYFTRQLDTALSSSVAAQVAAYYPSATVVAEGRYSLGASSALTDARMGGGFGTKEQPQLYGLSSTLQPFAVVGTLIADAIRVSSETGRQILPSVASPSWSGQAGRPAVLTGTGYWEELIYHLALSGAPSILVDQGSLSVADKSTLAVVATALQVRTQGAAITHLVSSASIDANAFVATAGIIGQYTHWRVTFAPGVAAARVFFSDGSWQTLYPGSNGCGTWFAHETSAEVVSMQVAPAGGGAPPFQILYDHAPTPAFVSPVPEAVKYLAVYQDNVDPSTATTGIINPIKVVTEVARLRNLGWTSSWGMLDFEAPFNAVLAAGPSDPRYATCVNSLVTTIRAVKAAFPTVKWTYYGFPSIPYWVLGKDWGYITEEQRTGLYDQYAGPYGPIMGEMDWFMPSLYDVYERAQNMPNSWSPALVAEKAYRTANVKIIQRYFQVHALPVPPIIPVVSPWFQPSGVATTLRPIPAEEFREEQVRPAIEAGADGIAIWGAMEYFLALATDAHLPAGYAGYTSFCRYRFAIDYLNGANVSSIDWYSPLTYNLIGGFMNQTLGDSLLEITRDGSLYGPGQN